MAGIVVLGAPCCCGGILGGPSLYLGLYFSGVKETTQLIVEGSLIGVGLLGAVILGLCSGDTPTGERLRSCHSCCSQTVPAVPCAMAIFFGFDRTMFWSPYSNWLVCLEHRLLILDGCLGLRRKKKKVIGMILFHGRKRKKQLALISDGLHTKYPLSQATNNNILPLSDVTKQYIASTSLSNCSKQ